KTFLGDRLPGSSARKRLYVSRRHAPNRRVVNEEAVVRLLTSLGFEVVTTETMSVVEQASRFADAGCVVAPHGAGLTNLVFCSPGTKVVDVFSPHWVNPCYWVLSRQAGLEYHYLIGEGPRPAEYHDPVLKGEDIVVNLGALASLLEMGGIR
ncbi:MAG: glycosyltransferase family 61 protein, partial [Ferruginibacter sp.]|nr:glycosyltransferase family 61 protein [Cytophagales bacterium]